MWTPRLVLSALAASVALMSTAGCSTPRSSAPNPPPQPPPLKCLEPCVVNTCTLSAFYDGKDDETRAAEEINCTEVNANAARVCAAVHAECGKALEARRLQPAP